MPSYRNDPRWITAKWPGKDREGAEYKKGDRVFYYPLTKTILVGEAAAKAAREGLERGASWSNPRCGGGRGPGPACAGPDSRAGAGPESPARCAVARRKAGLGNAYSGVGGAFIASEP